MSTIETRGYLPSGDKIYGPIYDRFIIGRNAVKLNFSVLPITDPKKDFNFYDCVIDEANFNTAFDTAFAPAVSNVLGLPKVKADDKYNPPLFFSTCSPGYRAFRQNFTSTSMSNSSYMINQGYFKGPYPYLTIDNTGSAGDFLPPGMMLLPSGGGMVHQIVPNGDIDYMKNSSFSRQQPFIINTDPYIQNLPMAIGHNQIGFSFSVPPYNLMINARQTTASISAMYTARGTFPTFSRFIGQDATYVYYLQDWACSQYTTAANIKITTNFLYSPELVSIKKSDGAITDILLPTTYYPYNGGGIAGLIYANLQEVMTTDATPLKAIVMNLATKSGSPRYFSFNKIVGNAFTNLATLVASPIGGTAIDHGFVGTQLMDNLQSGYTDSWKAYYPSIGYGATDCSMILMRMSKKLTGTPTLTKCTITGLPAEYESSTSGHIRPLFNQGLNQGNHCWAAEVYDGSDQYIAYWVGTARAKAFASNATDWANGCFSNVASDSYRYFLVFKVDPTDDSKLIYQSCVPEFKMMKPAYASVASFDNKHIVTANEDGIKVYVWSTASKSFVVAEDIALPGVWAISMDKYNGTGGGTVWAEVVKDLTKQHQDDAYLMQIDFGDYTDTDIRYWNGTTYKEDFTSSMLTITKDVNGNFESHTFDIQVRVKKKVGTVETAFVANETIRLKINGAKESDQIFFVGYDTNAPLQKTITTSTDWVTVTVNYKYPFANMSITAERITP